MKIRPPTALESFMRNRPSMSDREFDKAVRRLTARGGHSANRCTAAEQKRCSRKAKNIARHKARA